jgi:hypothetical protein
MLLSVSIFLSVEGMLVPATDTPIPITCADVSILLHTIFVLGGCISFRRKNYATK